MNFYEVKQIVEEKAGDVVNEIRTKITVTKASTEFSKFATKAASEAGYDSDAMNRSAGHQAALREYVQPLEYDIHNTIVDVENKLLGKYAGLFHQIAYEGHPVSDWPAKKLSAEGWAPSVTQ